jgi:hypothetical protein
MCQKIDNQFNENQRIILGDKILHMLREQYPTKDPSEIIKQKATVNSIVNSLELGKA